MSQAHKSPAASARASEKHLPTASVAFSKSLLKIKVPISVTLAAKKQPVSQILELGPGAMIQFEKSCEELLDLEVGGHKIAVGEAVKIGEKFGLRITSLAAGSERFHALK